LTACVSQALDARQRCGARREHVVDQHHGLSCERTSGHELTFQIAEALSPREPSLVLRIGGARQTADRTGVSAAVRKMLREQRGLIEPARGQSHGVQRDRYERDTLASCTRRET
jgi:hypothetical protein